ncbi:MAG: hypothetical protein ACYSYL_17695, partial [Planctomycetota bacterium]
MKYAILNTLYAIFSILHAVRYTLYAISSFSILLFDFSFQPLTSRPSPPTPRPSSLTPNPRTRPSTTVENSLQIRPFMQNKPNFQKSQMNVTKVLTRDYVNWTLGQRGKNKP